MSSKKTGQSKKLQELLNGLRDTPIPVGTGAEVFKKLSYDQEINLSDPVGKKEQIVYDDAWEEGYNTAWDEANQLILRLVKQLS